MWRVTAARFQGNLLNARKALIFRETCKVLIRSMTFRNLTHNILSLCWNLSTFPRATTRLLLIRNSLNCFSFTAANHRNKNHRHTKLNTISDVIGNSKSRNREIKKERERDGDRPAEYSYWFGISNNNSLLRITS